MSGGSWEYMLAWDVGTFVARHEDVTRMARRLVELGHADAAEAMQALAVTALHARIQVQAQAKALGYIMHAVEWHDSGDWTAEQVKDAVAKWRTGA
jgi:hypothetical protein